MNGEKGNWRGQLFDDRAVRLTKHLGYVVESSGKWGVDLIATSPPGPPAKVYRPLFTPNGKTAFEFTCEGEVGNALVDELAEKVEDIRKNHDTTLQGGVLGCDVHVKDALIEYGEKKSIFIWDVRDFAFLTQKVSDLKVTERFVHERVIDSNVTLLWKVVPREGFYIARVALLFHHPLKEVSLSDFKAAMPKVDELATKTLTEAGLLPAQVETEIRCRGHYLKDLTGAQSVLDGFYVQDQINYSLVRLDCYYQAAWSGMVPLE